MEDALERLPGQRPPFEPIRAVGCMSGTSLDGVDAAEIVTDGERIMSFGASAYRPYTEAERSVIREALGTWPDTEASEAAARIVEDAHAEVLDGFEDVDVIGFHGQTLAHEPGGRGTHQCGDGAALARRLGKRVVWDFRTSDVELGGQGAPLAPVYHFALGRYLDLLEPTGFLNLGGVGNLTVIDPRLSNPETSGALVAFDTGPANAPINDLMMTRLSHPFDEGGALAQEGEVDDTVMGRFLAHSYFKRVPPKSLDRDAFAWLSDAVAGLKDADAAATLTAAAATAVVLGLEHLATRPTAVLVTGGGRRNKLILNMLRAGLECPVQTVDDVGLDGDMLEAQAFGFMAVRVLRGMPTSFPMTTGVPAAVGGGEISEPG